MKNLLIKLFVVSMTMLNIAPFTFKATHAEKAKVRTHHVQQLIDIKATELPIKTVDEKLQEDRENNAKEKEKAREAELQRQKEEEERLKQEELQRQREELQRQREEEERQRIASLPIEEKIRLACERYSVDYRIVLAIARLETGWFKSSAFLNQNNPGGLSRNEIPMSFSTQEEGVEAFVSNLKTNYFDQGLDSPSKIGTKYCPVNPQWASMVERLM